MTDVAGKFTEGSITRHVIIMAATGSVGLMSIFIVDVLNLFYIAMLGEEELAAAVGYAGAILFVFTSVGIGVSIAGTALASRALGARDREAARRIGTSAMIYMGLVTGLSSVLTLPLIGPSLTLLGATGRTHELATHYLWLVQPSTVFLGLGMVTSGLLRAVGDANRAMWVTLSGGLVAAVIDPVLILWLGLGLDGAALASILSRLALTVVGLYGVVHVHRLAGRPSVAGFRQDVGPLSVIAVPAVLTNVATPVGNAVVTGAIAAFGDSAVAGWAVIGRLLPLAFGAIFALSGSVGPILGQNYGAKRFDRLRGTIHASLGFTLVYTLAIWLVLALGADGITRSFALSGEGAGLVHLFCVWIAGSFLFNGALFVANATFNNLGRPALSTLFNWGKATIGTLPFVWLGAQWGGADGVLIGQAVGGVLFGVVAVIACYRVIDAIAAEGAAPPPANLAPGVAAPAEVPAGAAERPPTH